MNAHKKRLYKKLAWRFFLFGWGYPMIVLFSWKIIGEHYRSAHYKARIEHNEKLKACIEREGL